MTVPFVVVSDFDGTITTADLVVALTTRVSEVNRDVVERINRRDLDLRDGLSQLFAALPSRDRASYEEYLRHIAQFRSGYHRFRTVLHESGIPFYIVSNGLDFMLDAVLGGSDETHRISNTALFDEDTIHIAWRYPCAPPCPGGCGLCKHAVITELSAKYQAPVILIGDGITDFNGAQAADRVYARGHLAHLLNDVGRAYVPYDTFDDVLGDLFCIEEVPADD